MKYSASSLDAFQTCPRLYKYKYLDRLPEESDDAPRNIGKAVHAALERFPNEAKNIAACDVLESDSRAVARGMVRAVNPVPWSVLKAEARFEISSPRGDIVGVLDGLVKLEGSIYILERKTSSMDPDTLRTMKTFDRQTTLYYFGAMALGYSPDGVVLDIITRPRLRRGKTESVESFEDRVSAAVRHEWSILRKTEADLEKNEQEIEEVIDLIELGKYPRSPGACYKFGKICSYFSRCAG